MSRRNGWWISYSRISDKAVLTVGDVMIDVQQKSYSPALAEDEVMSSNKNRPLIAIVDDNVFVCRGLQRLVGVMGIDCDTFLSGEEFLEALEGIPPLNPDCVILDVHMPGLSGLQVQERLSLSWRTIPVIFMSAADEEWIRKQALARGAVAFLEKPFTADLLGKTLRAVLKLASRSEPAA